MAMSAKDKKMIASLKSAVEALGMPGAELDYIAALRTLASDERYGHLIKGCRDPLTQNDHH